MKTFRRFGKDTWVEFDEDDCPDWEDIVSIFKWIIVVAIIFLILEYA